MPRYLGPDLRPYQQQAIDALCGSLATLRSVLLSLPTGSGKTLVAMFVVIRCLAAGGRVLWLSKDWELLRQAADVLARNWGAREYCGRIGGQGTALLGVPERRARVLFTTLHTLHSRGVERTLGDVNPTLIVWDEAHWGAQGQFGRVLRVAESRGIPVMGLTATPRTHNRNHFHIPFSRSFRELVDQGYLARPVIHLPVETQEIWIPARSGEFFDFSADSRRTLASSVSRNRAIVGAYRDNARRYGKTIAFACSIAHVVRLVRMFTDAGIRACGVHSDQSSEENALAIRRFRAGDVDVLVNMAMLTHGVDIPEVQTVFLCRPTASPILFAQMIGRGARGGWNVPGGKHTFNIVEFTDNVLRHGDAILRAQPFIDPRPEPAPSAEPHGPPRPRPALPLPPPGPDSRTALRSAIERMPHGAGKPFIHVYSAGTERRHLCSLTGIHHDAVVMDVPVPNAGDNRLREFAAQRGFVRDNTGAWVSFQRAFPRNQITQILDAFSRLLEEVYHLPNALRTEFIHG